MQALARLLTAALLAASCGPAAAPSTRPSGEPRSPVGTTTFRGTQAYACRDASGPGGGLLLEKDYIGEAKVLQVLGPTDLAVRTGIPLNILIRTTPETRFTPDTAKSFTDLGVKEGSVLIITVCWKQFDAQRTVGDFKGMYSVVDVTKE